MKIIALILSIGIIASSCTPHQDKELVKNGNVTSEKLGTKLMAIWEGGDTSIVASIFHPDGEYVDIPNNHIFKGIQGAKDYIGHVHNWGSNINMEIRNKKFSENNGYIEWTLTAIQSSPIKGRVPVATGKQIKLNGVTLIEVKDERIIKATDYLDALGFVIQLGSKIELPGGVIIGGDK